MQSIDVTGLNISSANTGRSIVITVPTGCVGVTVEGPSGTVTKTPVANEITLTHANMTTIGFTWLAELTITCNMTDGTVISYEAQVTGSPSITLNTRLNTTSVFSVTTAGVGSDHSYVDMFNAAYLRILLQDSAINNTLVTFPVEFQGMEGLLKCDKGSVPFTVDSSDNTLKINLEKENDFLYDNVLPIVEGEVTGKQLFQPIVGNFTIEVETTYGTLSWYVNIGKPWHVDQDLTYLGDNIYNSYCSVFADCALNRTDEWFNIFEDPSEGQEIIVENPSMLANINQPSVPSGLNSYFRGFSCLLWQGFSPVDNVNYHTFIPTIKYSLTNTGTDRIDWHYGAWKNLSTNTVFSINGTNIDNQISSRILVDYAWLADKASQYREENSIDLSLKKQIRIRLNNQYAAYSEDSEYGEFTSLHVPNKFAAADIQYIILARESGDWRRISVIDSATTTTANTLFPVSNTITQWAIVPMGGAVSGLWCNEKAQIQVAGTVSSDGTTTPAYFQKITSNIPSGLRQVLNNAWALIFDEGDEVSLATIHSPSQSSQELFLL